MWSLFNHMPLLEWYKARFVVKNRHLTNVCYDKIAQIVQKNLGPLVNTIGRDYATIERERNFTLKSYNFHI